MRWWTYRVALRARYRSMSSGFWTASLNIPSSSIDWFVVMPTRSNIASWTCAKKMSPVLCFVGGIHLIGWRSKIWRTSCAWASSRRNESGSHGSISYAWPRPICSGTRPARSAKASLMNWLASTVCALSTASAVVR